MSAEIIWGVTPPPPKDYRKRRIAFAALDDPQAKVQKVTDEVNAIDAQAARDEATGDLIQGMELQEPLTDDVEGLRDTTSSMTKNWSGYNFLPLKDIPNYY